MKTKEMRTIAAVAALAATVLIAGLAAAEDAKPVTAGDAKPAATEEAKPAAPAPLALGTVAPLADTKMKNVNGKEVSIVQAKGPKGTLVVFTCNACPWAKAWQSRIVALGNASLKRGIGVIVINPNDPGVAAEDDYPTMQANAKKAKMSFPYVVDATSDVARAFGATRTPEVFLFDREGLLVYHGAVDDNAKQPDQVKARYLDDAVNALVEGKAIAMQETKALGCSIKFRSPKT